MKKLSRKQQIQKKLGCLNLDSIITNLVISLPHD